MKRLLLTLATLLLLAAPAAAQDLEQGVNAYERGDYAVALNEFRPLAEQGDAEAQYYLGLMYNKGRGVPQEPRNGAKWMKKAAEQGYVKAQSNLGSMYSLGLGVPRDHGEAVKWGRKAAEQGYPLAQSNLGIKYYHGRGVPKDYVQAYKWFNLAAAQGNKYAAQFRDNVANHMTPEQIAEAQKLAREWMQEHGE